MTAVTYRLGEDLICLSQSVRIVRVRGCPFANKNKRPEAPAPLPLEARYVIIKKAKLCLQSRKLLRYHFAFCARQAVYINPQQSTVRLHMVQKGILKAEQGDFRKMHGTVDSILTLKMLIDKYVKSSVYNMRAMRVNMRVSIK